ncbi:MAG TPA: sialate O-acetylesterase [Flavitalea sp.]|nr:sialate O-acetylesterase [Flavitalea sp.]
MLKYFSLLSLLISLSATATISLPKLFGDHMVIQRNKPVHIWGWGAPGEKVSAKLGYASEKTRVGKGGKWEIFLPAMPAGGPYTLVLTASNTIRIDDVLSGEVWVCSGQSNMEWPLRLTVNADKEIAQADYPLIRHFKVPLTTSFSPKDDLSGGSWQTCTPSTAGNFTAVGYFFAISLYKELNIPVGLVNSSWGGTNVETWISRESFFENSLFTSLRDKMPANGDSVATANAVKLKKLVQDIQGSIPPASEEVLFSKSEYNDGSWKKMSLPVYWENAGLPGIDGTVWFRKEITIPAGGDVSHATLSLGPIDDIDSTFLNGVYLGSISAYNSPRIYSIQDGILKPGKNVVSIKVIDGGGGGGIYGTADQLYLSYGTQKISLAGDWNFRITHIQSSVNVNPNSYPTLLYNSMIHPLIPFPIAGAIWYQGESNAGRAAEYQQSFPLMIKDWRTKWKDEFPFYFVQLANYMASEGTNEKGGSTWAELREAQTMTLQVPKTGMAVTIDIGESGDIHPKNKKDVGNRLAANALAETYGKSRIHQGPLYAGMQTDGQKIVLRFNNAENGLVVKNKYGYVNGFEIAGADKKFRYARAIISGNQIIVQHDDIREPVAVRYGWADDPSDLNLYNKEGFPAIPFRTDTWDRITAGSKYTFNQ